MTTKAAPTASYVYVGEKLSTDINAKLTYTYTLDGETVEKTVDLVWNETDKQFEADITLPEGAALAKQQRYCPHR